MRKLIIIANIFLFATTNAQQPQTFFTNNPFPKTIAVSGSAEMEIVPDEIYVNVELKEYQKRGENKKDIETIKAQFLEACKAAGVPDSLISIVSYAGNNPYFWKKEKRIPIFSQALPIRLSLKAVN